MSDFDPAKYLTKLSGKDYLEVKFRLLWLRTNHPNAVIETEMIEHSDTHAIFKATVDIPLEGGVGGGSATGWGSETKGDFKDFLEKAETKAIGRALGALGFGTQFSNDHEFGADKGKVVDAPVDPQPARQRNVSQNTIPDGVGATQTHAKAEETPPGLLPSTPQQQEQIQALAQDVNLAPSNLEAESKFNYNGAAVTELNRRDAQDLIERLKKRRKPTMQAQMIDTTNAAERARN